PPPPPPPQTHGDVEHGETSLSLPLSLRNAGVESGFVRISAICSEDRIVCKVHSGKVITEYNRRCATSLFEFKQQVLNPLDFNESGGKGTVLRLCRASTHGGLLGALPGDKIGAIEDTEAGG
ncbi:hypothetical protein PIB30_076170, partial [Stylosanthes scabra]|nr:hypothetical protein [Stylosanthes scabra]